MAITIQAEKIKDNPQTKYWIIITMSIISILTGIGLLSREINTLNISFLCLIIISCFLTILFLLKRDFSDEIFFQNISHIKLKLNIQNNFIVRIINKKGKIRQVNLMDNQQEVKRLIENCEKHKINITYSKKIINL